MDDFKPTIQVMIYDWTIAVTQNGTVMSKNDAKGLPWAERRGRELELTDSHLGAFRNLILNVSGIVPDKQEKVAKPEPLRPAVRPSAMSAV